MAREAKNEVGISLQLCISEVYVGFSVDQNQYGPKCLNQFWLFQVSVQYRVPGHSSLFRWVRSIYIPVGHPILFSSCRLNSVLSSFCMQFYTAIPSGYHKILPLNQTVSGCIQVHGKQSEIINTTSFYKVLFPKCGKRLDPSFWMLSWVAVTWKHGSEQWDLDLHLSSSYLSWENEQSTDICCRIGLPESSGLHLSQCDILNTCGKEAQINNFAFFVTHLGQEVKMWQ